MDLILALSIGAGAALAALASVALLAWGRQSRSSLKPPVPTLTQTVILFRDGQVVDATAPAWALLGARPEDEMDWCRVHAVLHRRFANMPSEPPRTPMRIVARDDPATGAPGHETSALLIEPVEDAVRLTITGPLPDSADLHSLFVLHDELELLRRAMATAPSPVWQCDATGRVLWSNAAYAKLCNRVDHKEPAAPLFEIALPQTEEPIRSRSAIRTASDIDHLWFEVCSAQSGDTWLNYASDINAVVRAETAQRNFVQTLTKTFAHLPIGLAVFDRERRLALFNPALIDLTNLPADFLSQRPNLLSFFDHMRENRMMPEPKNYSGWREQMAELVAAATDDRYAEIWSLPSGLTYKITGRPHPNGAVAFLLEDISAEISLTRRFRSELELSHSVLDCIDDAVAVFSPLGVLTLCNAAYRDLWQTDPDSAFAEMTVMDATRQWQSACQPSSIWGELRDFVLTLRDRAAWEAPLRMSDGRHLTCLIEPVTGGATVVRFDQGNASSDLAGKPQDRLASV